MTTETAADPNELHDPRWKEGETVTLRAGNRTWAMVKRAETAMQRAAIVASGMSEEELREMSREQGQDAAAAVIEPFIDPVMQQLSLMRAMTLRWTLPWPLTPDGLEQLPEEYGQPIWDAIEARQPAAVPVTDGGDFRSPDPVPAEQQVPLDGEPPSPGESSGSVGAENNGLDTSTAG